MITDDFNGQVPKDRDTLLGLPGVGSYTAAAIGSFAYGRREIVLDTNVRRVIARVALAPRFPLPHQRPWNKLSPSSSHRVRRIAPHAGPLPRWSSALWCAALAVRAAMPAP